MAHRGNNRDSARSRLGALLRTSLTDNTATPCPRYCRGPLTIHDLCSLCQRCAYEWRTCPEGEDSSLQTIFDIGAVRVPSSQDWQDSRCAALTQLFYTSCPPTVLRRSALPLQLRVVRVSHHGIAMVLLMAQNA
uniref:Nuclear receptor domain-containing protein n=1 Tax=Steinernema glaseri TaxID=37863 RepID=A0A1I8AT74_9BILA